MENKIEQSLKSAISARNQLSFALRNFLAFSGPALPGLTASERPWVSEDSAFARQPLWRLAQPLLQAYDLLNLPHQASRQRCLEVLTCLQWLDWSFQQLAVENAGFFPQIAKPQDSPFRWLDAGSKNWAYVDALQVYAQRHCPGHFQLDGVELDPHRRYADFSTRGQAARRYSAPYAQANYHAGNLLNWRQPTDLITHFLPFVFADPHLAWGLPLQQFYPQRLLSHLLALLKPGGVMLVVNQGAEEAEAQAQLFERAALPEPFKVIALGKMPAPFIEYRYERYGWLCVKIS